MVNRHSSREEERKRMIMQRVLTQGILRRVAAVHPLLVGVTVPEPPTAYCCCALRLSLSPPTGQRWLSTSTCSKAAHEQKQLPRQEEPKSSSLSETQEKVEAGLDAAELDPLQDKSIGLVQRFKRTFKQYGKVMIPVHLVTSSFWFGTFYYAAMKWVLCFVLMFLYLSPHD